MTNSLLVSASRASLSSAACETAKSPAFDMRLNWRCSSDCPADFDRKEKDCVATNETGADSSRLYIPTRLGVGYSLIPGMAATRVTVGKRYSMASVPNSNRDVASARLTASKVSGARCHSPLISNPRYSSSDEHQMFPDLYAPSSSGS